MLKIWTSQKDIKVLDNVLRRVLPHHNTPHQILPFEGEHLDEPAPGDVVLGLGGAVLEFLKQHQIITPKNLSIGKARGKVFGYHGARLMMGYDPFMATVDPAQHPECIWDVALACRLHDTGDLMPPIGQYRWVTNFDDIIAKVMAAHEKTGKPVPVSPDLETIGLDPWHLGDDERPPARIVTISFSVEEGFSDVYRVPVTGKLSPLLERQINWLLNSKKVRSVGANLKFDMLWVFEHWQIECSNYGFDTMLVGSLVNENRSNSLNGHAKTYTTMGGYDDPFNAKTDKSRMDLALAADPEGFLVYAGGDTDACLRTYRSLRHELLEDNALTGFYVNLLHPASKVFHKIERRGVVVDKERYDALGAEVQHEIDTLSKAALDMLPHRIRNKYSDNLSLTRDVILRDFLFTKLGLNLKPTMFTAGGKDGTGEKKPSIAMDHLETFADHPEAKAFIDILRDHNSAKKTMSTYITGFLKHLRSDGRFHPTYMLHRGDYDGGDSGTVTGRTSAKDPAYQTIPKHTKWAKKLREVYVAPEGMAILKFDFSQGELRVTACVANEKNMIATYKKGIDLHLRTGALVNHITLEEALALKASDDPEHKKRIKAIRQGGKAGNFGLIYGMSAAGFQNYAWTAYGVKMTLEEAEFFRNAFFDEYPGLLTWHDRYKSMARRWGAVRSPLGRLRHLPLIDSKRNELRAEAERQAINSPIQSCLSDMMQLALVQVDAAYPDLWMFGMTHDDMGCYVPAEDAMEWAKRIHEQMTNLPLHKFGWAPQLDFAVDCEVSYTNLAECEEFKLAA